MTARRAAIGYFITAEDYEALRRIMNAIYDDRPLMGDRRRNLANAMYAVLNRALKAKG